MTSIPGTGSLHYGTDLVRIWQPGDFAFEAFLPSDKKEREVILQELEREESTNHDFV